MFETWEWWQWVLAGAGLLLCWGFVGIGWLMLIGGGGGTVGGGILGVLGLFGAGWATTSLMRHMPEQWGSIVLGLGLAILTLVLTLWLLHAGSWPVAAALTAVTFIAFVIDAFNRHLASVPMPPALLILGILAVLGLAGYGSTQRR